MLVEQFADEGARHDGPLVDIEGQAAHIDLVDEIGGGFSRRDTARDQIEDLPALGCGHARGRKGLELVGVKMHRFADEESGFRKRIGGAVREYQFGLDKAAHAIADEIQQRQQFARADLGKFRCGTAPLRWWPPGFGHQDLVQRAAAASSWSRASIQLAPFRLSSRFQNGAFVLR